MMKIERSPWVQGQGSYGYSARQPQQAMEHAAVHLGVAAEVLLSPAAREKSRAAQEPSKLLERSGEATGARAELEKLDDRKETVQSMKNRLGEIEKSLAEENLSEDDKLAMKKEQEQLKSEVIALSPEDKLSSLYELKRTLEKRAAEAEGVAVGETPRSMDASDMEALRMVDDLIGDAKDEVKAGSVKEKELRQTAGKEEAEQDVAKMKEQAKDETKAGTAPIQQQDSASVVFASTKGILLTKEQVAAATRKVQARAESVRARVASREIRFVRHGWQVCRRLAAPFGGGFFLTYGG